MNKPTKTNWDEYYQKTSIIASVTRKFTQKLVVKLLQKYLPINQNLSMIELGGANSSLFEPIMHHIKPELFHFVDNNTTGLTIFQNQIGEKSGIELFNEDILRFKPAREYQLVVSFGLIEHFNMNETAAVIKTHFDCIVSGGIALITFPTPTLLYRLTRFAAEKVGIWIFWDERPLPMKEVETNVLLFGDIIYKTIHWKLLLTQGIIIVRKK